MCAATAGEDVPGSVPAAMSAATMGAASVVRAAHGYRPILPAYNHNDNNDNNDNNQAASEMGDAVGDAVGGMDGVDMDGVEDGESALGSTTLAKSVTPTKANNGGKRVYKGKQPKWRDYDSLAAVRCVIETPNMTVGGVRQRKTDWHEDLKKRFGELYAADTNVDIDKEKGSEKEMSAQKKVKEVWDNRSGRSVAHQATKCLNLCRELKKMFNQVSVDVFQWTAQPPFDDLFRCSIALFNGRISNRSEFVDVFNNTDFNFGKPFPYSKTFHWVYVNHPDILDQDIDHPIQVHPNPNGAPSTVRMNNNNNENDSSHSSKSSSSSSITAQHHRQLHESDNDSTLPTVKPAAPPVTANSKTKASHVPSNGNETGQRNCQQKDNVLPCTANERRISESGPSTDGKTMKELVECFAKCIMNLIQAQTEAINNKVHRDAALTKRELELKERGEEMEAMKVLFDNNDHESRMFKQALRRKRLRLLLREEQEEKGNENNGERPAKVHRT